MREKVDVTGGDGYIGKRSKEPFVWIEFLMGTLMEISDKGCR